MFAQNALVAETGKLHKFALRLTRNSADADDLVQSTCLRALEKSDHFEDGSNLFSWTSKIMYNLFVTGYRRKIKFETQYDPEPFLQKQVTEPTQYINAEFTDVQKAMMRLSEDHRNILVLVCIEGYAYQEVAEMLQIPEGTVRSRLHRAREQLNFIMDTPHQPSNVSALALKRAANQDMPSIPAYIAHERLQGLAS